MEGKFNLLANGDSLRDDLDSLLTQLTSTLSDPHSQFLKQYSITYNSLLASQHLLDQWLSIQDKLTDLDKLCKLLDIKKLPEFTHYEAAERAYKQISKQTLIKGAESGVKLSKLLSSASEDKMIEIDANLSRVESVVKSIVGERRKSYPVFYLFPEKTLVKLITEPNHEDIEQAALLMLPGLHSL